MQRDTICLRPKQNGKPAGAFLVRADATRYLEEMISLRIYISSLLLPLMVSISTQQGITQEPETRNMLLYEPNPLIRASSARVCPLKDPEENEDVGWCLVFMLFHGCERTNTGIYHRSY
jgi:hypothetical protein